jgi:hypothetical protein
MNQPMRSVPVLAVLLLLTASLACNSSNLVGTAPTATPLRPPETLIPPTEPPVPTVPVPTLSDTPTPTPAASATPSDVTVTAVGGDVPCRFGPASEYSIDGKLSAGNTTLALARDSASSWIRIEHETHPRWNCWVKADDVSVAGNLASVPVEAAPASLVTRVDVEMAPSEATVSGCVFPYTFSVQFWITVNGPATVKLQRSLDNGSKAPVETQSFSASGRYAFTDHNRIGSAGAHWFQVDVFSPNAMSGRGTATAACGP